jgi:replication-associated recombination protein RarA
MPDAQLIQEYDANQNKDDLCNEMAKMIQIRIDNPFRLPRIILLGPPGSGKTFQGSLIAKRFGLTFVCMKELIDVEIGNKSANSQVILD